MYKWECLGIWKSVVAYFNLMPFKTNLLPLLLPHAATAAKVNTMISPYSCQTGVCVSSGKKVMKGQTKATIRKFAAIFSKIHPTFVTLLERYRHNCSHRKWKMQISHCEVQFCLFFFPQLNKVRRRNHCLSVSCMVFSSSVLVSDLWHFVSNPWVLSATVPHLICIYRVLFAWQNHIRHVPLR